MFLLSGGTTGIPKLIPRTHNDYLYNSKIAAAVCEIGEGDVLLDVLPIEHNLPLGCPGLQGFLLSGGTVVLGTSTRPRDVFELIQRHRVTHIHLVRLREKMMFGSDHPSLPYERILREWDELGYDQSVLELVFHANAERVLGL